MNLSEILEAKTGGVLHRKLLRPHDWHIKWPELGGGADPAMHPSGKRSNGVKKDMGFPECHKKIVPCVI